MRRIIATVWAGFLALMMPSLFDGFGWEIRE